MGAFLRDVKSPHWSCSWLTLIGGLVHLSAGRNSFSAQEDPWASRIGLQNLARPLVGHLLSTPRVGRALLLDAKRDSLDSQQVVRVAVWIEEVYRSGKQRTAFKRGHRHGMSDNNSTWVTQQVRLQSPRVAYQLVQRWQ